MITQDDEFDGDADELELQLNDALSELDELRSIYYDENTPAEMKQEIFENVHKYLTDFGALSGSLNRVVKSD